MKGNYLASEDEADSVSRRVGPGDSNTLCSVLRNRKNKGVTLSREGGGCSLQQDRKPARGFLWEGITSERKFTNHIIRAEEDLEKLGLISLLYQCENQQN